MRRSGKLWFYRTLPLLAVGVLGVMLLVPGDGTPQTAALAQPAAAPKPAIRFASTIASPAASTSFKLASHEVANTGAPVLAAVPAGQPVLNSPPWPRLDAASADPAFSPGQIGSVAVNMRAAPSSSGDKLVVLQPGETIQVGETSGGWTHVERADGQSGWVYSRFLASQSGENPAPVAARQVLKAQRADPPAAPDAAASDDLIGRYARLQGPTPVRSAPTAGAAALVMLDSGERVRISQTRGRWLRIVTADGISGWIPT